MKTERGIYNAPEQFKKPDITNYRDNFGEYRAACHKYIEDIKAWAKQQNPNDEWAGRIALFPVADGHAQYIVVSLRPVILIHDDTGDAYQYPYAHRLSAQDIKDNIIMNETLLQSIFKKPTKEQIKKEKELIIGTIGKSFSNGFIIKQRKTRIKRTPEPPVNIRMSLSKKQLDNSEGSGGLEITIPDCIGNPQEEMPGTSVFIEYYEGHFQVHVWDGTQQDPITIKLKPRS